MDYVFVFITLVAVLALFVWGRFRHDLVALFGLMVLAVLGVIPPAEVFLGFGHPAVVTVAVVLMIGKALENSGVVDVLGKWVEKVGGNLTLQILTLTLLAAIASAFMNNVGALAILMPVALKIARKSGNSPSYLLMPIAFASLLGGMTTLIGTPPNIIIATLRADETGEAFRMFDFSPVGVGLTVMGILFISIVGWRLLPERLGSKNRDDTFKIDDYITEVRVGKGSKADGLSLGELIAKSKADFQILGLVRKKKMIHAPEDDEVLLAGDIVVLETDTQALETFIGDTGLELVGDRKFRKDAEGSKDITVTEAVVMADSPLVGQTSASLKMRSRYGTNLLAVSRKEEKIHNRIRHVEFQVGDVVMLQGRMNMIDKAIRSMGCLPLAERGLRLGFKRNIALALGIFVTSILLVISGLLPVHIAFALAAGALVLTNVLPLKEMYESIDWSVIVLLGAMLPVGEALETSGGADMIANQILRMVDILPLWAMLGILLTVTMLLSGVINNAATVVLMAPIGIGIAHGMDLSVDPFLMVIAIGASASFLTPIGHQSNTLVMGPGGYRFGDYFRMGLPMTILIMLLAIPLILYFWPV